MGWMARVVCLSLVLLPADGMGAEMVRPKSDAPTLPPAASDGQGMSIPRSDNPLPPAEVGAPLSDRGIVAQPGTLDGAAPRSLGDTRPR